MFKKYLIFLDKLAEKFSDTEKIIKFLKGNKWKILIFFFVFKGLQTMYSVYDRGHCVNCVNPTETQMKEFGADLDKWNHFNKNFIFEPYSDLSTYLGDLILPLLMTWLTLFIAISIIYLMVKITMLIFSTLRKKLSNKIKKRFEEQLKNKK